MNYKKGFFRLTIVVSILTAIAAGTIGSSYFSPFWKQYNREANKYNAYYVDMLNVLNEKESNEDKNKDPNIDDKFLKNIFDQFDIQHDERLDNAKKYKIKYDLFNINIPDSIKLGQYVSVKSIVELKLNRNFDNSTKAEIASNYASYYSNYSFPLGKALLYLLLFPAIFVIIIWAIYYIIKFVVAGFKN